MVAAFAVANAVDMVWPGHPSARTEHHAWRQILIELAIIEVMTAGLIWQFAGGVSLSAFFASWWLGSNAYLVLPWLIAAALPPLRGRG